MIGRYRHENLIFSYLFYQIHTYKLCLSSTGAIQHDPYRQRLGTRFPAAERVQDFNVDNDVASQLYDAMASSNPQGVFQRACL